MRSMSATKGGLYTSQHDKRFDSHVPCFPSRHIIDSRSRRVLGLSFIVDIYLLPGLLLHSQDPSSLSSQCIHTLPPFPSLPLLLQPSYTRKCIITS